MHPSNLANSWHICFITIFVPCLPGGGLRQLPCLWASLEGARSSGGSSNLLAQPPQAVGSQTQLGSDLSAAPWEAREHCRLEN